MYCEKCGALNADGARWCGKCGASLHIEPDVFISYSTKNKNIADEIVSNFENKGIKCWYAPRDILPGEEWVTAIRRGLEASSVLVLIYTDESNNSRQVMNEIALGFNLGKTIVPFRLTESMMSSELEYYLTRVHWLDALSKPLSKNIDQLREYVTTILSSPSEFAGNAAAISNPVPAKSKKPLIIGSVAAAAVLILAAVLFFVLKTPNGDKLMKLGYEAYNSEYHGTEDNQKAAGYFEKAAKKGKADAYYYLGGLDLRKYDYASAIEHYNEGIDKGSELSKAGLAAIYINGKGTPFDLVKARALLNDASGNGCKEADYYLGYLTQNGMNGIETDGNKAIAYYESAKESKDSDIEALALKSIGDIYRYGTGGVDENSDTAIEYYEKLPDINPYYTGASNYSIGGVFEAENEMVYAADYYKEALKFYEAASEEGDGLSSNSAAVMYSRGLGTKVDNEKAAEYFRKAADAGNTEAMRNVGIMYTTGKFGYTVDYEKAKEWYQKSIDAGNASAMEDMGDIYFYGQGLEKPDYNSARQWYEKSAVYGNNSAMFWLGRMYEEGYGVEVDYDIAREWYEKAVNAGSSDALNAIGVLSAKGEVSENGEPDYVTATEWYKKAANAGNDIAMNNLGNVYYKGFIGTPDYKEAQKWYLKGSAEGNTDSTFNLGDMEMNGCISGTPDYEEAIKWFEKAADADENEDAIVYLGTIYENGYLGEADYETALKWYERGINAGSVYCMRAAGDLYYYAKLSSRPDYKKALEYYEMAADAGYTTAMRIIASYYMYDAKNPDYEEAISWFKKAADAGDYRAAYFLGSIYYHGEFTDINYNEARKLYEKAIEGETDPEILENAYFCLGIIYGDALGDTKKDVKKAIAYFEAGAATGTESSAECLFCLGHIYYNSVQYAITDPDSDRIAFNYFKESAEAGYASSMLMMGDMYRDGRYVKKDYDQALSWYEQAYISDKERAQDRIRILVDMKAVPASKVSEYLSD